MSQVQKQKGITLIALVITIIVLIILAGVAISLTVGENGILTKAKQAKTDYNLAKEKEELELEIANIQIEIMSQENRAATLNDLYARIDKNKYTIELSFDQVASTENVNTIPTYSIVNKIGSMYYFTVDNKLVIRDVETRKPKVSYITFGNITWSAGKASITLSTKEEGTIEYKVGEDGIYAPGTTIENLSHGDIVYARINNNGEYTEEETKVIYDGIKPEEFEVTTSDVTYNSLKIISSGTTDKQTGLDKYYYVIEENGNIVKKIENQLTNEYVMTGLKEKTQYVVYVLAYDKAENVRKSEEVIVNTLPIPIANVIGQYVNYPIDIDGNLKDYDWQIFYKEENQSSPNYGATYIIADYYVPYNKMTTSISNAGMSLYSGTYRVYWSSVPTYKEILDGTDSNKPNVKQIFMYDYTETDNSNAKYASRLLDTSAWEQNFVIPDLKSKGGLAIGSPTINIWCASWNKIYTASKEQLVPSVTGTGYQINGTTVLNITTYTGYTSAPNVYFPTKQISSDETREYILATPVYGTSDKLFRMYYQGWIDYDGNDRIKYGLRPLVYLPKEVKLVPSGTENVWNIDYGVE